MTSRYYCLENVPSPVSVPDGYTAMRTWGSRPYLDDVGCIVFGTVDYDRELTAGEMNRYGLALSKYAGDSEFKYYALYRPPFLGCIPRGAIRVSFMDERPFVEAIGRPAWGYAVYERELSPKEVNLYELARG